MSKIRLAALALVVSSLSLGACGSPTAPEVKQQTPLAAPNMDGADSDTTTNRSGWHGAHG